MTAALIAFGSNLQSPADQVRRAAAAVAALPQIRSLKLSPLYRTAPVGYPGQPDFVNAAALAEADGTAVELLHALQRIEQQFGRERSFPNAPRTLDLDLIDFGGEKLCSTELVLPHPRAHLRAFVMRRAADVAPQYRIGSHGTAAELAGALGWDGICLL